MTTLYRLHFPAPHQIRIQQAGFGVYDYTRTELALALEPDRDIPAERRAVFSKAFDMLNYYDKKRRKHNERKFIS